MTALEFVGQIDANKSIEVPPSVAIRLRPGQTIRVIVFLGEGTEDTSWSQLTAEQFMSGYAEGDAAYDHVPAG